MSTAARYRVAENSQTLQGGLDLIQEARESPFACVFALTVREMGTFVTTELDVCPDICCVPEVQWFIADSCSQSCANDTIAVFRRCPSAGQNLLRHCATWRCLTRRQSVSHVLSMLEQVSRATRFALVVETLWGRVRRDVHGTSISQR